MRARWFAILAALLPSPSFAQTDADPNGTFTFLIENDAFADRDFYYSSGIQLSWLSPSAPPDFVEPGVLLGEFMVDNVQQRRGGLALGQMFYTPQNTDLVIPDPTDRPYAAWLYLAGSVVSYSERQLNTLELQLGVVGPSALGEDVQDAVHDWLEDNPARGWDSQLRDEFGFNVILERKWRAIPLPEPGWDFGLDLTPHMRLSVGNVATYAAAGATVRLGQNLASDFGAPLIRPSSSGSAFFDKREGFGWYIFAGVEGRAVAQDIFLDGNTFVDSPPSVDKKPLVADFVTGAAVLIGSARVTYAQVMRTEEFDGQDGNATFGSLSVSWSF
jgi:lipid A 3-O-deacylase